MNELPTVWQDFKFKWDKDLYKKKITIKKKGEKKSFFDESNIHPGLPPQIVSALKQIHHGASVLRSEDEFSAGQFVQKHKISEFTDELNKSLTQKYGVGFASEVFKYLLEQRPSTNQIQKLVHNNLDASHEAQEKVTFIIARGYAHTVMGNDLFRYLKDDLGLLGYEVIMAETDAFGRLEQNEEIMYQLVNDQIKQGKKVVLIGTCVGLVSSLGALERIRKEKGSAPLFGIINIAGMLKGSFVVDWGTRMPQWFFIKRGLFKEYKSKGGAPDKLDRLEAMKDFRFERIGPYMQKVGHAGELSQKSLNLVSILPGNGLGRDKSGIRRMQDEVSRPNIKKGSYGANDGIIEYPGTVLDEKLSHQNMSLVFESSHNFLDGYYDSFGRRFDLRNDNERRQIFGSVIRSFLES